MENNILIATAWWPTKTKHFEKYYKGVIGLLNSPENVELFITTKFHCSKFGSNFKAIEQCVNWAIENSFSHVLILDADVILSSKDFISLIEADKYILLAGRMQGEGITTIQSDSELNKIGWGCSLIKTNVFRKIKLEYVGDFLTPDRMWFKKARLGGYDICCHNEVIPNIL